MSGKRAGESERAASKKEKARTHTADQSCAKQSLSLSHAHTHCGVQTPTDEPTNANAYAYTSLPRNPYTSITLSPYTDALRTCLMQGIGETKPKRGHQYSATAAVSSVRPSPHRLAPPEDKSFARQSTE